MGTKSRETIYGASIRAAAERAAEARKEADRLAVEAWNKRMLGFQGPAQPSPALGDAINAGFGYLEVKCLGCNTHQTVALDIVRRPKATPIHELERYMRCKDCSQVRGPSLQAQPSGRAAADQDFGQRSGVDMVAGRTDDLPEPEATDDYRAPDPIVLVSIWLEHDEGWAFEASRTFVMKSAPHCRNVWIPDRVRRIVNSAGRTPVERRSEAAFRQTSDERQLQCFRNDVQPLQHHHEPSRHRRAVPRRQPLCRQPRADAGRVSGLSGSGDPQHRHGTRDDA